MTTLSLRYSRDCCKGAFTLTWPEERQALDTDLKAQFASQPKTWFSANSRRATQGFELLGRTMPAGEDAVDLYAEGTATALSVLDPRQPELEVGQRDLDAQGPGDG